MARQKKIVPYVPQTAYPKHPEDYWRCLFPNKQEYNLEKAYELLEEYSNSPEGEEYSSNMKNQNNCSPVEYFKKRIEYYNMNDLWQSDHTGGIPKWGIALHLIKRIFPMTAEFATIHGQFMNEYDSRPDLQEVYKTYHSKVYYLYDRFGKQINNYPDGGVYSVDNQDGKKWADRPESFRMFHNVYNHHEAQSFIEKNREARFQAGDIVRLRDPYVGHPDIDPLYANRWVVARGEAEPTPDRSTIRLGLVMQVTDRLGTWRGTKGSKILEILWFGKEESVMMQEKHLRFETRPTKANGLLK